MNKKNVRTVSVTEITYGQCPPELTITLTETIQSVNLHEIILTDVKFPNVITGLRIEAIEAT